MDDVTKTLIAVLAGFITAFLAEPVKIYFQKRARLRELKVGLYKEMWANYATCRTHSEDLRKICKATSDHKNRNVKHILASTYEGVKTQIRGECYGKAINDELLLFYQLPEAHVINVLRRKLSHFITDDLEFDDDPPLQAFEELITLCEEYPSSFAKSVMENGLDKAFFKKIMGRPSCQVLTDDFERDQKRVMDSFS
jgi:hypothetical protein